MKFKGIASVMAGLLISTSATSVMAFDFGKVAGEVQKAMSQQSTTPQEANNQAAKPGSTVRPLPAKGVVNQNEQAKQAQSQPAEATEPVRTEAIFQIKNIKLGMTVQELVKAYPQIQFEKTVSNTDAWVQADMFSQPDRLLGNCLGKYKGNSCVPLTVLGTEFIRGVFIFMDNKLSLATLLLDSEGAPTAFNELVDGLSERLNAKAAISKQKKESPYLNSPDTTLEKAEWTNPSSNNMLVVKSDAFYTKPNNHTLFIQMVSGNYEAIKQERATKIEQLRNEVASRNEKLRKTDF